MQLPRSKYEILSKLSHNSSENYHNKMSEINTINSSTGILEETDNIIRTLSMELNASIQGSS